MSSQAARAASACLSLTVVPDRGTLRADLRRVLGELGLPAGLAMERLVGRVLARFEPASGQDPRWLAEHLLVRWVERLLQRPLGTPRQALATARAAVLLSDAAARWPESFLGECVPPELTAALARALPQPLPEAQPLAMPIQSLEPVELPRLLPPLRPARIARRP